MNYRREIDGLRAVAVLPVILFHAGFSVFSGGFVGVDVFFVISGYLITSILIAELEQGNFSIARFYERRARRILPALFVVMLACLPFAYMWMLPSQLEDFSESLVTVVLSLSNIYFLSQVNYFAPSAELQPLLHTWSLAIEEQYYFLFPLMMLAMWRFKLKAVAFFVGCLVLLSFVFAEWAWRENAERSFFFTLSRFWEIGVGSICAFLTVGKTQRSSNVLSMAGLVLIVFAIFVYSDSTPFPSVYTLAPVAGTGLVILFAGENTWVARLLSMRGFVGIGLISYSAYLWHQPLFAFARLRSLTEPNQVLMGGLAVAALLLAWATWRWVETPFRKRANPVLATRRRVFAASGAVCAVFVAIGLAGHVGKGFEWRLKERQLQIIAHGQPVSFDCEDTQNCLLGDARGEFTGIAFVGDSHMGRYAYLLNEIMLERQVNARLVTKGWCAPLLHWRSSVVERCGGEDDDAFEQAFRSVLTDKTVETVVMAAEWANYTTGYRHGARAISYDFEGNDVRNKSITGNEHEFDGALKSTISELRLAGKSVVLVGPVPEYDFGVPLVALSFSAFGELDFGGFELTRSAYDERNDAVFSSFSAIDDGIRFIDVWPIICGAASCSPFSSSGFPLYSDGNHLVREGMVQIVDEILKSVQ